MKIDNMKFSIYYSQFHDAAINLALEEELFMQSETNYLLLYRNNPALIIGKNQIPAKEMISDRVNENGIEVIRRISGGGTVYHDLDNLNLSMIFTKDENSHADFRTTIQPLFNYLKSLVPTLSISEKNDLLADGKKISGSAMHIRKNRVLMHLTLLVNSDLVVLRSLFPSDKSIFNDKSIASRPATVANLSEFYPEINIETLVTELQKYLIQTFEWNLFSPDVSSLDNVNQIADNKYRSLAWNIGKSPDYRVKGLFRCCGTTVVGTIRTNGGLISGVEWENSPNITNQKCIEELESFLIGKYHYLPNLQMEIKNSNYHYKNEIEEFIKSTFLLSVHR